MIMGNNSRPTDDELQEKALYDIIQYLPLDKVKIEDNSSINLIIEDIEKS